MRKKIIKRIPQTTNNIKANKTNIRLKVELNTKRNKKIV